jgi:hypothetical protein
MSSPSHAVDEHQPRNQPSLSLSVEAVAEAVDLAQVVSSSTGYQDVLQQSKELREIVNRLQTSPAQQTLLGAEQGGQAEQQIA